MSAFKLFVCAVLIFASASASASEVALFSLSRFQLRSLKDRLRLAHRRIKHLMADPDGLLITILVFSEVINVSLSTLIAETVAQSFNMFSLTWIEQTVLGTLITAPIILIFCDITPKAIGARANLIIAPMAASPLSTLYNLFTPVRIAIKRLLSRVSRMIGQKHGRFHDKDDKTLLKEEEFMFMLEEGKKEGAVRQSEVELIRNVFDLDDTEVKSLYTPLSQVFTLSAQTTMKEALELLMSRRYSRIPITSDNRKKIIGILHSKDLILNRLGQPQAPDQSVMALAKKPLVVSPKLKLSALFRKFKRNRTHLAIIENAFGEALGIISMDDVIELLFDNVLPELEDEDFAR